MKDYMKIYKEWLDNPYFDEATKEELRNIAVLHGSGIRYGRPSRYYWRRNQPYEYLHSPQGDTGTG